jgi:hypothetical protein
MVMEASMATVLIALALISVAQLLVAAGRYHRAVEWRQLAHRTAGNVMERIMLRDDRDVTAERLVALALPEETLRELPSAGLAVDVRDTDDQAPGKRIQVDVSWRNLGGQPERVSLVAWKYSLTPRGGERHGR